MYINHRPHGTMKLLIKLPWVDLPISKYRIERREEKREKAIIILLTISLYRGTYASMGLDPPLHLADNLMFDA